jgi:hypothetical protein
MQLEKQVCSLDLAKRLKELGAKQESLFYWGEEGELITEEEYYDFQDFVSAVGKPEGTSIQKHYSAFTVSELGEMLPVNVKHIKDAEYYWLEISKSFTLSDIWSVEYLRYEQDGSCICFDMQCFNDENEANARAEMLIYLLENKLIKVPA